jgi:Protein of unknown function (DUF3120)
LLKNTLSALNSTTIPIKDVEILQIPFEESAERSADLTSVSNSDYFPPSQSLQLHGPVTLSLLSTADHSPIAQENRLSALFASAFLVAVPVFVQAPLVRAVPTVSLALTLVWLWLGSNWLKDSKRRLWGDLIIGFSWTWLAGAIYWGWFRWNPYIHLPIEAVGLPIVLGLMLYGRRGGQAQSVKSTQIGNYFYIGSLLGTAITDLYFYYVGLIPYWRLLMISPPTEAGLILHRALLRMETYQGVGCAIVLLSLLIMLGTIPMRSPSAHWWAFSGAVLSTIVVDSLFFIAAIFA